MQPSQKQVRDAVETLDIRRPASGMYQGDVAKNSAYMYVVEATCQSYLGVWSLLLLAETAWSFARLSLDTLCRNLYKKGLSFICI